MEPDSKRVINVLQAGRAIAALAVVVHHSAIAARDFAGPFPGLQLLRTGQLGVDFFFVLSGFIIYHSTVEKHRGAVDYSWSRIRRLYLPYWPVGIGTALVYLLLPGLSRIDHRWDWLATLTLSPTGPTALGVAWTLQQEAFFYLLFGLLFFTRTLWLGLIIWALAILAFPDSSIPLAVINFEFLMGIGAAVLYRRGIGHWLLLPVAVALVVVWALRGAFEGHSPLIGLACACAVLQLSLMEKRGLFRVPALLVFLGDASYALYLVHAWTISVVARIVPQLWPVILVAGVAASLPAGIAYYLYFERPILRAARKWRLPQPRAATLASRRR